MGRPQEDFLEDDEPKDDSHRYSLCGFTSAHAFSNWDAIVATELPIMFPKDDIELQEILETASANGCRVRASGTTHSFAGVVVGNDTTNTVVVSLADYAPNDADWNFVIDEQGFDEPHGRFPGRATQLDMYQRIRGNGHNYFLSSQTAGWMFSMGGIISNSVHGGLDEQSYIHAYVTRLRVMYADGSIDVLDQESDLRYWRNGFGLIGIITGAEITLEKRDRMYMSTVEFKPKSWNEGALMEEITKVRNEWEHAEYFYNGVNDVAVATVWKNLPPQVEDDTVYLQDSDCEWNIGNVQCYCPSCPRKNKYTACSHQYRLNDWTLSQSCRPVEQKLPLTDDECTWDTAGAKCNFPNQCSYQFQVGDSNLENSCRLTIRPPASKQTIDESYTRLQEEFPDVAENGVFLNTEQRDLVCLSTNLGLLAADITRGQVQSTIKANTEKYYGETNDGFVITSIPQYAPLLGYFVPLQYAFQVFDKYRTLVRSQQGYVDLLIPLEFRIVKLTDSAVLQPGDQRSGYFVALELTNVKKGNGDYGQNLYYEFEQYLKSVPNSFVHTGKAFGYADNGDGFEPFQDSSVVQSIFTPAQKEEFLNYRSSKDPSDLFFAGDALSFF